ncbi:MFS transporter [Rhodospirillaceae bacterium SYSU D60014]|uniref:MFS transporter n=1 Tax=Virgifigura deserti TaxID=2268457 RepID=UPI000E66FF68
MEASANRRNVLILAACQALAMTGSSLIMTVSALVGQMLAAEKSLATLPLGLQFTATMLTTIPASLLMKQIGRRAGFTVGALIGAIGAGICTMAVFQNSFAGFCVGNALVGVAMGFALFYRFAAADAADERFRSRAISFVMAGGVVAAVSGPELAKWSRDLFEPVIFAGCFLVIAVLWLVAALLLQIVDIPRLTAEERRQSGRPLGEIARQPVFLVAALGGMVGYGMMSLVMTATPLAMVACAHSFRDAAFVIQWHVLGMFAPSFFTGHLIARFGVMNIMLTGVALLAGCVMVNLSGTDVLQFWVALVLLGLGWNFLYIGSTTLLTESYQPAERAKVQALNDFLVFGSVAASSFSSGALQNQFGWEAVNYAIIAPATLVFLAILWLRRRRALATA